MSVTPITTSPRNPRAARFWVYWNGCHVRLSLKPGESVEMYSGGETEEGWSSEWMRLTFEDGAILREWNDSGRDCDGHHSRNGTDHAAVERIASDQPWQPSYAPDGSPILIPVWSDEEVTVYDAYAQAAGY
jgi:hypothetical protein